MFRETTNPEVASGDGIAMAWAAGARVADLEFVQFHPTALQVEGQPRFLLSEALRGEGARLVNADGEPFMTRYEEAGDLAPRDRVSRAIVRELARTGHPVFLSLQHLDPTMVHARFPHIAEACRAAGLDLARDPVPVSPAAHYVMGGVETDLDGRTSVPGLFAAGEVACTGVHGANRLASNSLLEGLVFGRRAGQAMVETAAGTWPARFSARLMPTRPVAGAAADAVPTIAAVRERMWTPGRPDPRPGRPRRRGRRLRGRLAVAGGAAPGRHRGPGAAGQPYHGRWPDGPRRAPARGEPRRPLPQ